MIKDKKIKNIIIFFFILFIVFSFVFAENIIEKIKTFSMQINGFVLSFFGTDNIVLAIFYSEEFCKKCEEGWTPGDPPSSLLHQTPFYSSNIVREAWEESCNFCKGIKKTESNCWWTGTFRNGEMISWHRNFISHCGIDEFCLTPAIPTDEDFVSGSSGTIAATTSCYKYPSLCEIYESGDADEICESINFSTKTPNRYCYYWNYPYCFGDSPFYDQANHSAHPFRYHWSYYIPNYSHYDTWYYPFYYHLPFYYPIRYFWPNPYWCVGYPISCHSPNSYIFNWGCAGAYCFKNPLFHFCSEYYSKGIGYLDALCKYEAPPVSATLTSTTGSCLVGEEQLCPTYKGKTLEKHQEELISQIKKIDYNHGLLLIEEKDLEKNVKYLKAKDKWTNDFLVRLQSNIEENISTLTEEESPYVSLLKELKKILEDEKEIKEKEKEKKEEILELIELLKEDISSASNYFSTSTYELTALKSISSKCYNNIDSICKAQCGQDCKITSPISQNYHFYPDYRGLDTLFSPSTDPWEHLKRLLPEPITPDSNPDLFISPPDPQMCGSCTLRWNEGFWGHEGYWTRISPGCNSTSMIHEGITFSCHARNSCPVSPHGITNPSQGDIITIPCNPPNPVPNISKLHCSGNLCWERNSLINLLPPSNREAQWWMYNPNTPLSGSYYSLPSSYSNWYDIQCTWNTRCLNGNPCPMNKIDTSINAIDDKIKNISGEKCQEISNIVRLYEDIEYFHEKNNIGQGRSCGSLIYLCEKYPNELGFCDYAPFKAEDFTRLCSDYPNEPYFCSNDYTPDRKCDELVSSWQTCKKYPKDAVNFNDIDPSQLSTTCNTFINKKYCSYPEDFEQNCNRRFYKYKDDICGFSVKEYVECGYEDFINKSDFFGHSFFRKCFDRDLSTTTIAPEDGEKIIIIENAIKKENPCLVCKKYPYQHWFSGTTRTTMINLFGTSCERLRFICETHYGSFYQGYLENYCNEYPFENYAESQCDTILNNFESNTLRNIPDFLQIPLSLRMPRFLYETFCWVSYEEKCTATPTSATSIEETTEGLTNKIIERIKNFKKDICEFHKMKSLYYTHVPDFCEKCKEERHILDICREVDDSVYLIRRCERICNL